MSKISDISKLANKLDLQGIVKNVKSMISPGSNIPASVQDDPIAYRIIEITKSLKVLTEIHAKQADELAKIDDMLGALYNDVCAVKNSAQPQQPEAKVECDTVSQTDAPEYNKSKEEVSTNIEIDDKK